MRHPNTHNEGVDPFAVLDVNPGSSPDEVAARYRELAKRWHPDVAGAEGEARMAEINSAYDLVRSELWQASQRRARSGPETDVWGDPVVQRAPQRRRPAGEWLDEHERRALGPELLGALHRG